MDHIVRGFVTQELDNFERMITHTLLDYGHQFIGSLHAVNSRSQTRVYSHCNFIGYWSIVDYLY